jgi:PhnB protein
MEKEKAMQTNAYLLFNGQCEEAFTLYAKVLGGKIESMMPHEGTPAAESVPKEWRKKILHAKLNLGDTVLMASDAPPGRYEKPAGFSVNIGVQTPAEAERVYSGLSQGGKITMPLAETFWALKFGMFVDRFGTPWMINCEAPRK